MKTQVTSNFLGQTIAATVLLLTAIRAMSATQIASQLQPGAVISSVGGGRSYDPIVTPDGRYALFASTSANLVAGSGGLGIPQAALARMNVYVRERQTGTTVLVSVNSAGTAGGNGDSFPSAISSNGQFVAFESAASDLMAVDNNGVGDVFVRDIVNNTITRVSVSTNGSPGNGPSRDAAMTPDGRYVAFVSAANNLVAGDTNGIPDVFVRDLQLGVTTLASVGAQKFPNSSGTPMTAGSSSEGPVLSVDGRYVAFFSTAVGLVTNVISAGELYVRDLVQGETTWVSTNAHQVNPSAISANYTMSTNGQWIAYQATGGTTAGLVFRYNVLTGVADAIATNGAVAAPLDIVARNIDISADGRFVAFTMTNSTGGASIQLWEGESGATSLISGGSSTAHCDFPRLDQTGRYVAFTSDEGSLTTNSDGAGHIYVRDTSTSAIQLVDVGTNGVTPIAFIMTPFCLSADGGMVAFDSLDGALSSNPYKQDVFARDFAADKTEIISAPAPALPSLTPLNPSALTTSSISSNGQYVAFFSSADGIVSTDTNGCRDLFAHDLVSGSNALVSVSLDGVHSGNGNSSEPAISGDGRYVAFSSYATNLVASDTNNTCDVFRRDLQTGTTTLVSADASGLGVGNSNSFAPQISADGMRVLFSSLATNLTTNATSAGPNLFWRDVLGGVTYSLTTNGIGNVIPGSVNPALNPIIATMTPDSSNVVFAASGRLFLWNAQSHAAVGVAAPGSSPYNVAISADAQRAAVVTGNGTYAVDLAAQTSALLAAIVPGQHMQPVFSGDGRFLAYLAKTNSTLNQICLYDFEEETNILVSSTYDSSGSINGTCDSPAVNATGRFVAYRSAATNLAPGSTNGFPNIFLYDRLTGGTTLLSVSGSTASAASGPSLCPVFSGDGQTLFFESWAADLVPGDFNESSDVFALVLPASSSAGSTNTAMALKFTGMAWQTANGQFSPAQPLILSWPAVAGTGYEVQFKDNLADPDWQVLASPPTVVGNQGQIIDSSPDETNRFYRIISF